MQKKKKGFTLVELLVVIAILAILAGVSVVGYLSFTEKAKESNDSVLVTQLNTVLQADEASDGKPKTMSQALDVLKENGFLVENLTPSSSKNEFLYNLKSNRFEIKSQEDLKNLNNGDYWYVVEDEETLNNMKSKCSVYLSDNLSLTNTEVTELKYGFDGLNSNATKVAVNNIEGPTDIVLNTNAKTVEVNAPDDNVSHFGTSETVTVTAVANNSYHEYGIVNRVEVTSGHVEFMPNCKVEEVYITANTVKVTITDKVQAFENINIVLGNGVQLPEGSIIKPEGSKDVIEEILVKSQSDITRTVNVKKNKQYQNLYYKLVNDIEIIDLLIKEQMSGISRNVVIDLNGFKLTNFKGDGYTLENQSNLLIKNGTLDAGANQNTIKMRKYLYIIPTLIMNNVNIIQNNNSEVSHVIKFHNDNEGKVNLVNCNFNGQNLIKTSSLSHLIINGGTYTCNYYFNNLIENNGELIINNGVFKAESSASNKGVIVNNGTLIVNGGEFITPKGASLYNHGTATLNGGRFISKSCSICNNSQVSGTTHYVYSVYSGGTSNTFLTINDGVYIEGVHGGLAVTSGGALINGGTIKTVRCDKHLEQSSSHYALYLAGEIGEATVTISGGEFVSTDKVAMYVGNSNDGGQLQKSRVIVTGGTFNGGFDSPASSDKTAIKVDSKLGYLTITGGKYSSDISKVSNLEVTTNKQGNYWVVG